MSSIFDKLMGRIGVTREPVSRGGGSTKLFYSFVNHFSRKRYPFRIPSIDKWYPFHITSLELWVSFRLVTSRPLISRPATERASRTICQVRSNGFESYYKFTREKMMKICCVGSRVKYHSLSYWSFVMTSPVEFATGEFRAKQVWKVL